MFRFISLVRSEGLGFLDMTVGSIPLTIYIMRVSTSMSFYDAILVTSCLC